MNNNNNNNNNNNSSERQDITLLKKIDEKRENIRKRLEGLRKEPVTNSRFELKWDEKNARFKFDEMKDTFDVNHYLKKWKPAENVIKLKQIDDDFNDKIDYSNVKSIDDLERLTEQMKNVSVKYRKFGGTVEAVEVLEQFLHNMNILDKVTETIHNELTPNQGNIGQQLKQRVDNINKEVQDVFTLIQKQPKQQPRPVAFDEAWSKNYFTFEKNSTKAVFANGSNTRGHMDYNKFPVTRIAKLHESEEFEVKFQVSNYGWFGLGSVNLSPDGFPGYTPQGWMVMYRWPTSGMAIKISPHYSAKFPPTQKPN